MAQATVERPADANAGAHRAYQILHLGFTVLPIIAGVDKFFDFLTNWDRYLAPVVSSTLGVSAHTFMQIVGVIEIVAGLLVAVKPRIGAYLVAGWLLGIIGNLALHPDHYWDVAARDFGLFLGALSLGSLSAWVSRTR
jgi:uncharacterized membrane protein YphA (DoxX/SURF4 family)